MGKPTTYLIKGEVLGNLHAYVTNVLLELKDGGVHVERVLVNKRGKIQELTQTSQLVSAVRIAGSGSVKKNTGFTLEARRVGRIEFTLRQAWRIFSTWLNQSTARRSQAGLTLKTVFLDLDEAYDAACRLRANVRSQRYDQWYREFYDIRVRDRRAMQRISIRWNEKPIFQINVIKYEQRSAEQLDATLDSLKIQTYTNFHINLFDDLDSFQRSLRGSVVNEWSMAVRPGTILAPQLLFCLADVALKNPAAAVIYSDHDQIDKSGNLLNSIFKPDWSAEMLRSTNYIGESFVWNGAFGKSLLHMPRFRHYSQVVHSLLLSLTDAGGEVVHIPGPFWHLQYPSATESLGDAAEVVSNYLNEKHVDARVEPTGPGRCRIRYSVATETNPVSIVIPTRDNVDYLRRCITSIQQRTSYGSYEIVVMDNRSTDPETLTYLSTLKRDANIRVFLFDEPFNYSRVNNVAVELARYDLICLLNNDTEVISEDWLEEMVGHLLQNDDVGVVGAKLLFADGSVQHAGDTVGPGGCANHLHVGIGSDDGGYADRALLAQDMSAVTAACLLTKRALYLELGGLNEKHLKIAFNDVDYCLRVRAAGKRVIWTPHALLYHHESVSRGKPETGAAINRANSEVRYMKKKWAHLMKNDPFYNLNLNYLQPDFSLSSAPKVYSPWTLK